MHASVYLATFVAGVSGVALWGDGVRGVAGVFGGHLRAAMLHRWSGYVVAAGPLLVVIMRRTTVIRFFREISRIDGGDANWWRRFPAFLIAPRSNPPGHHRGHFDPGQRLMAWGLIGSLFVLLSTGLLMVFASLGGAFGFVSRVHTVSSVLLAMLLAGHIGVGIGIPKGYRGVWRAMHFWGGGKVPEETAQAIWPEWSARSDSGEVVD